MIYKENIYEIEDLFKSYFWLIYIPCSIYFVSTIYHIIDMKKSIQEIGFIAEDESKETIESLFLDFRKYEFLIAEKHNKEKLFKYCRDVVASLRWEGFENKHGWRNEIDRRIIFSEGALSTLYGRFNKKKPIVGVSNKLLNIGEKYPLLRKYISQKLAESIIYGFVSSFSHNSGCFARSFNPVVQRFGGNYYIYPDIVENIYYTEFLNLKVNGRKIYNNKYLFHPISTGMKYLDIEYTFRDYLGAQTLQFRKGLRVTN